MLCNMNELNQGETARYARHLTLPEVGHAGQLKLKNASVLVVGMGGLGSPAAMYLAAAGVGRLGIVDFDAVDESNLHRQIIYGQSNLGERKVESAQRRLLDINSHIDVVTFDNKLTRENALNLFSEFDIVADGTDNFPTRYLVNDACQLLGKPNVYASIFRFEGQVSVFDARKGPCYRCLFPKPPPPGDVPSCAEGGVLGVLPGIVGTLQANEVIKLILGIGESLVGKLLTFSALTMRFHVLSIAKDPKCCLCSDNKTFTKLAEYEALCGLSVDEIKAADLASLLETKSVQLVDVRESVEWEFSRIEGSTLMPLSLFSRSMRTLSRSERIVVYCESGMRSARAFQILKNNGFDNVTSLQGGMAAWRTWLAQ
jgi:molybdopterin/thiamine biosynthesis adenylyltransferase/rhodanese-related sulfurtransferase